MKRTALFLSLISILAVAALLGRSPAFLRARGTSQPSPSADAANPYRELSFQDLGGYDYKPGESSPLPQRVTELNHKKVQLSGFMVPVDIDENGVASFVLVKDQMMCCYGVAPAFNEWVFVSLLKRVPVSMDLPVHVSGTLEVGEDVEDGEVLSLYRMNADQVEVSADEEPLAPPPPPPESK